jgi:hypothetical protein
MCPAIHTEPTLCVVSGLGAGHLSQAAAASIAFISLAVRGASWRGPQIRPAPQAPHVNAPRHPDTSIRKHNESESFAKP